MARLIRAIRFSTCLLSLGTPFGAFAITAIEGAPDQVTSVSVAPDSVVPAAVAAYDPAILGLVAVGVAIVALNVRRRRRGPVVIS